MINYVIISNYGKKLNKFKKIQLFLNNKIILNKTMKVINLSNQII